MSEKPDKPNSSKLKLRKTVVKDMPLRTGQAGKVKGGKIAKATSISTLVCPPTACV